MGGLPFFEGWEATLKSHFKAIPAIPDGGYTRGHFFEFTEGSVSMRETITSEIFHQHNYVGIGSMGIVRESMLRRIFGNTPFESASLADIILPRHRARVWDEKKTLNFREKFASIPSEYRSYYPQPPQIETDGIESKEISCNKKRGRPFNVTGVKNTDQKNVKKSAKPVVISDTNSILKYFGTKVEKAIALPSKSINEIVNIFFPPVNISDVHVVSTSTAEDSEVSDIRTSITAVIEEDDRVINTDWIGLNNLAHLILFSPFSSTSFYPYQSIIARNSQILLHVSGMFL